MSKGGLAHLALFPVLIAGAVAAYSFPLAQRAEFDVASVKRNTTNGPSNFSPRRSGDLVIMHNTQPYNVIWYAYDLTANYQIEGYVPLPDGWNWYDIDARAPAGANEDQIRLMFQSLLADRFKLRTHTETKQITGYELVTDKGKPKLKPSREGPMSVTIEGKTFTQPPGVCSISSWSEGSHLICHSAVIDKVIPWVSGQLKAPVVDRTGLTGIYDLDIHFLPDERKLEADVGPVPSLADALRDLGLRLDKGKAPVKVLVIDHMEKPSDN